MLTSLKPHKTGTVSFNRFDNGDLGLSSRIDPDESLKSPYALEDLAEDAVGLLQALGIQQAHIIGGVIGGAVAQRLAISHPNRVLSLTSLVILR